MIPKYFRITFACGLLLAAVVGCQKQQQGSAPASQNEQPAQPSADATGAAPGAPRVDPSKSPIADPASPLYGWEKFSSPEGKFSAIFPNKPQESDQATNGRNGEVQMHLFIAETDSHNDAYEAGYYDLPRMDNPKMALAKIEEGMVKKTNSKIVSYKPIQLNNHSGTEFEIALGNKPNVSSTVRLISAGQRVYLLMAIFQTGHPNPNERDAFFNSFTLQN